MPHPLPKSNLPGWILTSLLLLCAGVPAQEVSLRGDRVTIRAANHTLRDVMAGFARYEVRVRMDPAARAVVNGDLADETVEEALATLLKDFGYTTRWRTIPGPGGPVRQLVEIAVFSPASAAPGGIEPPPLARRRILTDAAGVEYVADEVLIGLRPGITPEQFQGMLHGIGGSVVGLSEGVGVYRVVLPAGSDVAAVVAALRNHPHVAAAEPNRVFRLPTPGAGLAGDAAAPFGGLARPPATLPPADGAAVAVLDSGLSPALSFGPLLRGGLDAVQPGTPLADSNGHGTHMALLASGLAAPEGVRAGDPQPFLAVRAFDDQGVSTTDALLRSFEYARTSGARVASLSWGTTTPSDFLASAVHDAQEAGLIVVAAAGNEPNGLPVYPAAYPGVVGVGATDAAGVRWEKSNYGDFVDLSAPGFAALPNAAGETAYYAGTSIATPWVARNLAAYLAQNPGATSAQAVQALTQAVRASPASSPNMGAGVLDNAAVNRLLSRP